MSKRIRQELLALRDASEDKMLHAATVVAWAKKNKKSALHSQFEWDDTKAAQEYRIWQARRLIQITVVMEDGSPALVSLSFDRTKGGGYRGVDDVVANRDLSDIMLRDALGELNRVQAKFARVKELTRVWHEVRRANRKASRKLTTVSKKKAA